MRCNIVIAPEARRNLKRLHGAIRRRIADGIDALADDPRPPGAVRLAGDVDNLWRIRVGDYRIVYRIQDDRLIVLILRIGHRRDVYKKGR
ncbi:MAG: type II toxin-antitoxin system RelE family toxin [Planctomycetaceae bacterium]